MSFVDHIDGAQVKDPKTFAFYAQQRLGCPHPTGKDHALTGKMLKDFAKQYPDLDVYPVMVRVVDWCAANRKRFSRVHQVIGCYRFAYKAGVLGELVDRVHVDENLEQGIAEALQLETNSEWRDRLAGSFGDGRRVIYESWTENRRPQLVGA